MNPVRHYCRPTGIINPKRREVSNGMKIKTKDLWQSAFMLAKGSNLQDIRLHPNGDGRKEVIFTLSGDDINELTKEFRSGQALCNISRLRASMIHLKEEMYKIIRS